MIDVRTVHTASLTSEELEAIRALLHEGFAGDVTEDDFEHALGGVHALAWQGEELVAHGSVVMRRLLHEGRSLRTGYVEAVAVRPDRRRRGLGSAVMAALEEVVRGGYELGALASSDDGLAFYRARGWQLWTGTTSVVTPQGMRRTPDDDGCVFVLPGALRLRPGGDLACDWRPGDVW